jgi:AcrR family transcriptional regulator
MGKRLGRPKATSSAQTRQRLLRAARQCFAELGYEGASNKAIAQAAGLTAAAIYNYVPSKRDLYVATVEDAFAAIMPGMHDSIAGHTTFRSALEALLRGWVRLHAADPSVAHFLAVLPVELQRVDGLAEAVAGSTGQFVELLVGILALADGALTDEIPQGWVLSMLLACFMGMLQMATMTEEEQLGHTIEAFLVMLEGRLLRAP